MVVAVGVTIGVAMGVIMLIGVLAYMKRLISCIIIAFVYYPVLVFSSVTHLS